MQTRNVSQSFSLCNKLLETFKYTKENQIFKKKTKGVMLFVHGLSHLTYLDNKYLGRKTFHDK